MFMCSVYVCVCVLGEITKPCVNIYVYKPCVNIYMCMCIWRNYKTIYVCVTTKTFLIVNIVENLKNQLGSISTVDLLSAQTHTYTGVHTEVNTHIHTCLYVCVCIYVYACVCIYVYACVYICMYVYVHSYMYVCARAYVFKYRFGRN